MSILSTAALAYTRVARCIQRAVMDRALHRVGLELATTQQHLDAAEDDLARMLPPEVMVDVQSDVVELRSRLAALEDEWAYVAGRRRELEGAP